MELFSHSQLGEIDRQRLELLKKPQAVSFLEFSDQSYFQFFRSPEKFKQYHRNFWLLHPLNNPGDFALPSAQSSGVVGQGASI